MVHCQNKTLSIALIEVYSIAFIIMRITVREGELSATVLKNVPRDVVGKLLGQQKDSN